MVTFTINIPPMLAYLPYMDPMGVSYQRIFSHSAAMRDLVPGIRRDGINVDLQFLGPVPSGKHTKNYENHHF